VKAPTAYQMPDFSNPAERLRVQFLRARDQFSSFFKGLEEATQGMTPAERASWCLHELRIGESVLRSSMTLLTKADAAMYRDSLRFKEPQAPRPPREKKEPTEKVPRHTLKDGRAKFMAEYVKSGEGLSEELKHALTAVARIEAKSRIELGEQFVVMRDLVKSGAAGRNPNTNKRWNWSDWGPLYLNRSYGDIKKCIAEFGASCAKSATNRRTPPFLEVV
jgi:hypothetical protein